MKTPLRRACLSTGVAILVTVLAVSLSLQGGAWGNFFALLAIPAYLGQLGFNDWRLHAPDLSHGVGLPGYLVGIVTWSLILWVALTILRRQYLRFLAFKAAHEKEPPPEA